MDLGAIKWPQPVQCHGLQLRPLSQSKIEQAASATAAWAVETDAAEPMSALDFALRLLHASAGQCCRHLHTATVIALAQRWARLQRSSTPDPARLDAFLRLRVLDDPLVKAEGAVAYHAPTASEFYGAPLIDLTLGQLVYYWTLRSAYREMHVDNSTKRYSRRWLEKQANESG